MMEEYVCSRHLLTRLEQLTWGQDRKVTVSPNRKHSGAVCEICETGNRIAPIDRAIYAAFHLEYEVN